MIKHSDLRALGLVDQKALNFVISNVESVRVKSLFGLSPIEYTQRFCPELWQKLNRFGIQLINGDDIDLTRNCLRIFVPAKEDDDGD